MPLTVNEIVHNIQLILMSLYIKPGSRLSIISFVKAGFDVGIGLSIALNNAEKRGRELHSVGHEIGHEIGLSSRLELIIKSIKETELR